MNDDAPQEFDMVRMIRDLVKRVSANPITDTTDLDRCIRDHVLVFGVWQETGTTWSRPLDHQRSRNARAHSAHWRCRGAYDHGGSLSKRGRGRGHAAVVWRPAC